MSQYFLKPFEALGGNINVDKLVPARVDLSKLSDVLKNDFVKKAVYDKFSEKVNNIDTSGFVLKNMYDTDKTELENKIPDTSGLIIMTDYNAKITEIESKIPGISGLATSSSLTTVESKIPIISSLVKKQIITQKLLKSKINLQTIIMTNILLLQSLII